MVKLGVRTINTPCCPVVPVSLLPPVSVTEDCITTQNPIYSIDQIDDHQGCFPFSRALMLQLCRLLPIGF